jgi:hypothetical protein
LKWPAKASGRSVKSEGISDGLIISPSKVWDFDHRRSSKARAMDTE